MYKYGILLIMQINLNIENEKLKDFIRNTIGALSFQTTESLDLFDKNLTGGLIFQIIGDCQLVHLEKDDNFNFSFYHYSPGTGTRIARISIDEVEQSDKLMWFLNWSTDKIELTVGPMGITEARLHNAVGVESKRKANVNNGHIMWIGSENAEVMGVGLITGNNTILLSTAKDLWNETKLTIDTLRNGFVKSGYIQIVVKNNLTILTLITGLEIYLKARFLEIYKEGITTDINALIDNYPNLVKNIYYKNDPTILINIIDNKTNFQNFKDARKAYQSAYKIDFLKIIKNPKDLDLLKKVIRYRHRLTHGYPLLAIINESDMPDEELIGVDDLFTENVINIFDNFINTLHTSTLSLKRCGGNMKEYKTIIDSIKEQLKLKTGSFQATFLSNELFDLERSSGNIIAIYTDIAMLSLDRDDQKFKFSYYQADTGLNVTYIDIPNILINDNLFIVLNWEPNNIKMSFGKVKDNEVLINSDSNIRLENYTKPNYENYIDVINLQLLQTRTYSRPLETYEIDNMFALVKSDFKDKIL